MSGSDTTPAERISRRDAVSNWITCALAVIAIIAQPFTPEMRAGIAWTLPYALRVSIVVAVVLLICLLAYYRVQRRRRSAKDASIEAEPALEIRRIQYNIDDKTQKNVPEGDQVLGRHLHLLEYDRPSKELMVFLPGLGLDAEDFEDYMRQSRFHCIGLTMFGFNPEERTDPNYQPISLEAHMQVVLYALCRIRNTHPHKELTVCGFSIGADQFLLAPEVKSGALRQLEIRHTVLLDPNVNKSTMLLSGRLAHIDGGKGVLELNMLTETETNEENFHFLSGYKSRICLKNLDHLRRFAEDIVGAWDCETSETFLKRLNDLHREVGKVTVVMSSSYRGLCDNLAKHAGTDADIVYEQLNHFKLLRPELMEKYLNP